VQQGWAPRYAKGVMERVVERRGLPTDVCHVSSPVYPIGTPVYVYGLNTGVLRGCIVSDVSQAAHKARHIAKQWWAELGFREAESLCGERAMREPPRGCPILVIRVNE
jgi:hypothetical protein